MSTFPRPIFCVQSRRNGFTLVELLVVISIIAVLISILLPSLSKARESARTMACLSTERQLGIATSAYITDWKGWYPAGIEIPNPVLSPNAPSQGGGQDSDFTWAEAVFDYLAGSGQYNRSGTGSIAWKSVRYFRCASDPLGYGPWKGQTDAYPNCNSYSMNACRNWINQQLDGIAYVYGTSTTAPPGGMTWLPNTHSSVHTKESWVISPSDTFVYVDTCGAGRWSWRHSIGAIIQLPATGSDGSNPLMDPIGLHSGKYNWLLADGHAYTKDMTKTLGTGFINAPKGIWTKTKGD